MKHSLFFITLIFIVKLLMPSPAYAQNIGDVITLGDSLTAGLARISGIGIVCAAQGNRVLAAADQLSCRGNGQEGVGAWQPRLKAKTGGLIYNFGNTGETTLTMTRRFVGHLNQRDSKFVLILAGTNDMIFGVRPQAAVNNIKALVQQALDRGRTPIVATLPPLLGGGRAAANPRVEQLNALIRQLPQQFDGLVVAEIYNRMVSGWPATYSADTVHFNDAGNQLVADIWFAAMQRSQRQTNAFLPPIINLLLNDDE